MTISRRALLAAAASLPVAVAGHGLAATALAQQFATGYHPRAESIADGIWMVRGADEAIAMTNGGAIANSAFIATDEGTILFDPGPSREYALALAALAEQVTGKPVTRVYVSHLHPDHALGAAGFAPELLHALPETRRELVDEGEGFADGMYRILADWMKGTALVLPNGDVKPGDVTYGGRKLRLLALQGHSGGDLALLDHATGTLIAGDLVFNNRAPATPHADIAAWQKSLTELAAVPHNILLPGHGPLDTGGLNTGGQDAIAQTADWLGWLDGALHDAVAQGLDMAEAGNIAIPGRFAGVKLARYELQRSVSHFYPALEAELLPRL